MTAEKPLAVSVGDPAGIGPRVALRAASARRSAGPLVLFGDGERLAAGLLEAGVASADVVPLDPSGRLAVRAGAVGVAHVAPWPAAAIEARAPTAEGGAAQLAALDAAIAAAASGRAAALVTGPASKAAITLAGEAFSGHTERLAAAAGLSPDAVTMMFLGPRLRTALVTTHLAVRAVPDAITTPRVLRATVHLAEALVRLAPAGALAPAIAIASLNPHAGEGGLFGSEERDVIEPAVRAAREREPFASSSARLVGVVPAETAFRRAADGTLDGVVAMMHDQATIPSKLLDWGHAVNVTWGLPFVRTSVDHGVAYDAAAEGGGDDAGMVAALDLAWALVR